MVVGSGPLERAVAGEDRQWWWLRLLLGLTALGIGVAALVWPEATVRVVGFLFGVNLIVTGAARAVLSLFVPDYPPLYRVVAAVFGTLTAIVGIFALRHLIGSALLLVFIIGVGWLLDGLGELVLAAGGGRDDPGRGWRVAAGVGSVVAAFVVFVWPELTLATFLAIGALILIIVGVVQTVGAIAASRHRRAGGAAALTRPG
ncbi:MAG TPA: DUF308 domain-containing protein [Pilimelia sp.]|nr:DUF308 domain-containing protein [Pilimelia sp.]